MGIECWGARIKLPGSSILHAMNINDITLSDSVKELLATPDAATAERLLHLREKTFKGFAELETRQGIVRYPVPLSSKPGQDMVRLFLMRAVEEVLESLHSRGRDHRLEELIDAINYMLSIPMIDPGYHPQFWNKTFIQAWHDRLEGESCLLDDFLHAAHPMLEKLRNRAWQNQSQDTYFNGWNDMHSFMQTALALVFAQFDDWEEFTDFFLRKDAVLQFRLTTNY